MASVHGSTPDGTPETRNMWIPADAATIEDTWSVVGMCGTGSHDFRVDDVFVPATHTFSEADPPQETGRSIIRVSSG